MTLHNTGDLVQIKSRLWFEENKNIGTIFGFTDEMAAYCGMVLQICDMHPYRLKTGDGTQTNYCWKPEWFEDEVDNTHVLLMNNVFVKNHCEIGDIVEINSTQWYVTNKNKDNIISTRICNFTNAHSLYCGKLCKVVHVYVKDDNCFMYKLELYDDNMSGNTESNGIHIMWTDYMFKRLNNYTENNKVNDIDPNLYDLILNADSINIKRSCTPTPISIESSLLNAAKCDFIANTYEPNIEVSESTKTTSIGKRDLYDVEVDDNKEYKINNCIRVFMANTYEPNIEVSESTKTTSADKSIGKRDLYDAEVDDNKEYKINTCVRICSRDTIKNNNERTYLTHNCKFDVRMFQYCNNIYYIDEVIDFGLWHFKLYKLRTSDNNILPYLWSNYWFYSLEDEDNNCSEYKFNKQKVILNF